MTDMLFRKRDSQPTPPWITWMLVGFLIFAILGNFHKGTNSPSRIHSAVQKAEQDLNVRKFIPVDSYKSLLFPHYEAALRVADLKPGKGAPVQCGQTVSIAYDAQIENGAAISDRATRDHPLTFRVGGGKAMPAFEQGVIGMRPNGERAIFAPPQMAYGIDRFARNDVPAGAIVRLDTTLLSATPTLPDPHDTPYRIAVLQEGAGPVVYCGDPVKIHLTLWNVTGEKLFFTKDKEPITFTPGLSEMPLGIEEGVIAMKRGGARTLVLPPDFQKTMDGNAPRIALPFPDHQTVLADIEALP